MIKLVASDIDGTLVPEGTTCFLAADQHDVCDSFFQDLCSSFIGSAVLGLRQNDGFLICFCSFFDYVNKSHDS